MNALGLKSGTVLTTWRCAVSMTETVSTSEALPSAGPELAINASLPSGVMATPWGL